MRIISQTGMIDLPYDKAVLLDDGSGEIRCVLIMAGSQLDMIAKYSTPEIARNVMQNLHKQYTTGSKVFRFPREGEHGMLLWKDDEE